MHKPRPKHRYHCDECGVLFHPKRDDARFCSARCGQRERRRKATAGNLEADESRLYAAKQISAALDQMMRAWPKELASQWALELLMAELTKRQPLLMALIMEKADIREAYATATAEGFKA